MDAEGVARLRAALHALDARPAGPGWNHGELSGLLPATPLREAAVLVGLCLRADACHVLLTRRTDALRHHAGQVSFPGGRVEPGDADAVAAALREAHEEIGLAPAQVAPLGLLDPLCTITGFRVVPVVGLVAAGYVPAPDPVEVAEVFEVPLDFLLAPANLRYRELVVRGVPRRVLEFADHGGPQRRIWGATASILFNLRERLAAGGPRD